MKDPRDIIIRPVVSEKSYALIEQDVYTFEDAMMVGCLMITLLRHADRFVKNPRMATQVRAAQKLGDAEGVRHRARDVITRLRSGQL